MLSKIVLALAAISSASAHMQMSWPYPLHSTFNPATPEVNKDYSQTSPLPQGGGGFPCKGYINNPSGSPLMDSVATIQAGSTLSTKFAGTASHRGGSCQWSMSYDMGATWTVVHTQMGGCMTDALSVDVPIPSAAPSGEALFGWTWFNNAGNREMYMNCAVVTVAGGGSGLSGPSPFVANAGVNQCATIEGVDTVFPNPGNSVSYGGSYASSRPTEATGFTGSNCVAPGASSDSSSGSGSGAESSSAASSSSVQAAPSSTIVASSSEAASSSTANAKPTGTSATGAEESSISESYTYIASSTTDAASSVESASSTYEPTPTAEAGQESSSVASPASNTISTSTGRVCRIKKRGVSVQERSLHPGQKLVTRRTATKEHRRSRFGRIGHIGH